MVSCSWNYRKYENRILGEFIHKLTKAQEKKLRKQKWREFLKGKITYWDYIKFTKELKM